MNSKDDDEFTIPDTWHYTVFIAIIREYGLKQNEAHVMSFIGSFSKKNKWCFVSQKKMGIAVGVKEDAIRKALHSLERMGLIERNEVKYKGKTFQWRLSAMVRDKYNYITKLINKKGDENKRKNTEDYDG